VFDRSQRDLDGDRLSPFTQHEANVRAIDISRIAELDFESIRDTVRHLTDQPSLRRGDLSRTHCASVRAPAAAAATTTEATAPATATATIPAATTAAAGWTIVGLVDVELTPVQLATVDGVDRLRGLARGRHFDEPEAA
jgi:hypothetical protein